MSQIDMDDGEPSEELVRQFMQNVKHELDKARERGVVVGPNVAVYADPSMLIAANKLANTSVRLLLEDGSSVVLAPPPADYTLGTMEQEIDRAAQESIPTNPPPAAEAQA